MKKAVSLIYPFEQVDHIIDSVMTIAKDLELKLEFIHAVEPENIIWNSELKTGTSIDFDPLIIFSDIVEDRKRTIQKVLSLKNSSIDFPVMCKVSVLGGSISKLIHKFSKRPDVDIVLLPFMKESQNMLAVSDMVDQFRKPVFVFSLGEKYHKIKTIVYATSFNESDVEVLKQLAIIAKKLKASITVCHICKDPDYDDALKLSWFQQILKEEIYFLNVQILQEKAGEVPIGIKEFCKKYSPNMVVLLKEDKNLLQTIFCHSTTNELLNDCDIPLLIFKK